MNSLFIWHFDIRLFYCGCFDCFTQSLLQLFWGSVKWVLCYIKLKTHTETHAKPKTQHQCQPTVGFLSGFVCCASSCWIICQAQRVGNFIFFFFSFLLLFLYAAHSTALATLGTGLHGVYLFFFFAFFVVYL